MGLDQKVVVLFSSLRFRKLRRLLVCFTELFDELVLTVSKAKFQHYMYGGRPLGVSTCCNRILGNLTLFRALDVRFNDRWHTFTPTAAKGGQVQPIQADIA